MKLILEHDSASGPVTGPDAGVFGPDYVVGTSS
jgi:hypothetical protein